MEQESTIINENYIKLFESLQGLIKFYRALLNVVRKEKDILVSANLDDLNENNKTKEDILLKIRSKENIRLRYVNELSKALNFKDNNPRLLDFAIYFDGERGEELRKMHSVLELLIKRIQGFNKKNESLINSALENINGAMREISDTLHEKTTYQRKGGKQPAQSGQLVSREV